MITSDEILNGLQSIADKYEIIAILWHSTFFVLFIAFGSKWKPTNKFMVTLLCLPLLSVALLAWKTGNPFNGTTFSIAGLLMLIFGSKASDQPIRISESGYVAPGIFLLGFGLVYPHFTDRSFIKYIFFSPLGLIPCPTLSAITGLALIFNSFESKPISRILIFYGLFYGLYGVIKLKVYIDLILFIGTLLLLTKYFNVRFKKRKA